MQAYEAQRKAWVQSAMAAGQQQRPDGQQGGSDQASKGAPRPTLPEPTCDWRQVSGRDGTTLDLHPTRFSLALSLPTLVCHPLLFP